MDWKRLFAKIIFFLLSFYIVSLNASAAHTRGAPPSWVKPNDFPVNATPINPSQINLQYLLIDTQRNLEAKNLYRHLAIKALTQSGIEAISQIQIDFDPSYTHVVMHDIRIFRDGQWHDRLENARHNLIQRETELEKNLYNGDLTLIYFLNDIRAGDIVEYAYSLIGESPLASSHYTERVYMQRGSTVEKITHRLLANPSLVFTTKPINVETVPQIRDLTPTTREWIWEATETPPYVEEPNQPAWYNPAAQIQMSEYRSWGEVIQNILPLYALPDDYCSLEMRNLIKGWNESSADLSKKALFALRFVQDEVRYLGFEDGMGAFQPTHPAITLQRRFGDCKDKTFLLHALLKAMNIHSKMVLVHTTNKRALLDVLPTPFVFNHIVLQLEIGGTTYFVDPTMSLQGGTLEKTFFPDYDCGLVLAENTSTLTPLPKSAAENPTEIDSRFAVVNEDTADLAMKTTFYGASADRVRRSLKWRGAEKISQDCLSEMQDIYGIASLKAVMEASDDRDNNIVTLIESYCLPTREVQSQKRLDLISHTLRNYLCTSINPQRSSPYEISYPLWVKEQIQIETPLMEWAPFRDNATKSHEAFFYSCTQDIKKHQACFTFELRHLQDHIPKHTLLNSWQILSEISRKGFPCMTVATSHVPHQEITFLLVASASAFVIWLPIYLISGKRPAQDALILHLHRSQVFYSLLNVLSLVALGPKVLWPAFMPAVLIPAFVTYNALVKRSAGLILGLQVCLILQACATYPLLFMTTSSVQIFVAVSTYSLYAVTVLGTLNKARVHLRKERNKVPC